MKHRSSTASSNAMQTREELRLAQSGCADALGRLFDTYRPYLLKIANQMLDSDLRPKAGASDLVQESLLEAYRDFARFRGTSPDDLFAWLRGILRNTGMDFVRHHREAACRQISQEQLLDASNASNLRGKLVDHAPSPPEAVIEEDQRRAVWLAVERLPDDYRTVLALRHQEDRSFEQIAQHLNRSVEAVRKLWYRAVDRLREEMKEGT